MTLDSGRTPLTRSALWGLLLSTALVPLGSTMIAVALPAIGDDLGGDPALLTQWLVNSYLIAGIVLLSPAGKLGDLWGARRALGLGQILFAVGAALGLAGTSLAWLIASRITMAAGGALIGPATMALLRNTTDPARRGRVFGMFGSVMGLSAALGPPLGGALVEAFGWRSIFLANLPVLGLATLLVRGLGRPVREARPVRFDWVGSLLIGAALTAALGASRATGIAAATLLTGAALLVVFFVRWERSVPEPVLDPGLFGRSAFSAGSAIVALHNLAMYSVIFELPLWLGDLLGYGSAEVGRLLLGMLLSMVVCSSLGGRASEHVGARAITVFGTATALVGLLLLSDTTGVTRPLDALLPLVFLGMGLGLSSAPAQAAAMSAVTRTQSGMAAGALSTVRYLGGIVGIGVLGVVLRDVATLDAESALRAHRTALWIFSGALLVAVLPAALLPGRRTAHVEEEVPATPV